MLLLCWYEKLKIPSTGRVKVGHWKHIQSDMLGEY